jgi:hypothetical protein
VTPPCDFCHGRAVVTAWLVPKATETDEQGNRVACRTETAVPQRRLRDLRIALERLLAYFGLWPDPSAPSPNHPARSASPGPGVISSTRARSSIERHSTWRAGGSPVETFEALFRKSPGTGD